MSATPTPNQPNAFDQALEDDAEALQHAADELLSDEEVQAALNDENRDDVW